MDGKLSQPSGVDLVGKVWEEGKMLCENRRHDAARRWRWARCRIDRAVRHEPEKNRIQFYTKMLLR